MSATAITLAASVALAAVLAARVDVVAISPPAPVPPVEILVEPDPRCDPAALDAELADRLDTHRARELDVQRAHTRSRAIRARKELDEAVRQLAITLAFREYCEGGGGGC